MNRLSGTIASITHHQGLFLATLTCGSETLTCVALDLPALFHAGTVVDALFKETEVILAKGEIGEISLANRLGATITQIQPGKLLSQVRLDSSAGTMTSIITTGSLERLALKKGDNVTALIKANEVSLGVPL